MVCQTFCITVRAVDHDWRSVVNATALSAEGPKMFNVFLRTQLRIFHFVNNCTPTDRSFSRKECSSILWQFPETLSPPSLWRTCSSTTGIPASLPHISGQSIQPDRPSFFADPPDFRSSSRHCPPTEHCRSGSPCPLHLRIKVPHPTAFHFFLHVSQYVLRQLQSQSPCLNA